ncbi:hypothetical protein JKP88DRAFT_354308 [Tribonema minus]|uniref:PX domain-containing protein n=1 Tax=Tribonema minus TaxID=303371 RepID=A0A835Z246_9STRA|nr:hypothetical protein JKP88DRAFT_354308 [Tribonema minus]
MGLVLSTLGLGLTWAVCLSLVLAVAAVLQLPDNVVREGIRPGLAGARAWALLRLLVSELPPPHSPASKRGGAPASSSSLTVTAVTARQQRSPSPRAAAAAAAAASVLSAASGDDPAGGVAVATVKPAAAAAAAAAAAGGGRTLLPAAMAAAGGRHSQTAKQAHRRARLQFLEGLSAAVHEPRIVDAQFVSYKVELALPLRRTLAAVRVGDARGAGAGAGVGGEGEGGARQDVAQWAVWRRITDFAVLRAALLKAEANHGGGGGSGTGSSGGGGGGNSAVSLPVLPHSLRRTFEPDHLAKRAARLHRFMEVVLQDPLMRTSQDLFDFITPREWDAALPQTSTPTQTTTSTTPAQHRRSSSLAAAAAAMASAADRSTAQQSSLANQNTRAVAAAPASAAAAAAALDDVSSGGGETPVASPRLGLRDLERASEQSSIALGEQSQSDCPLGARLAAARASFAARSLDSGATVTSVTLLAVIPNHTSRIARLAAARASIAARSLASGASRGARQIKANMNTGSLHFKPAAAAATGASLKLAAVAKLSGLKRESAPPRPQSDGHGALGGADAQL